MSRQRRLHYCEDPEQYYNEQQNESKSKRPAADIVISLWTTTAQAVGSSVDRTSRIMHVISPKLVAEGHLYERESSPDRNWLCACGLKQQRPLILLLQYDRTTRFSTIVGFKFNANCIF